VKETFLKKIKLKERESCSIKKSNKTMIERELVEDKDHVSGKRSVGDINKLIIF